MSLTMKHLIAVELCYASKSSSHFQEIVGGLEVLKAEFLPSSIVCQGLCGNSDHTSDKKKNLESGK